MTAISNTAGTSESLSRKLYLYALMLVTLTIPFKWLIFNSILIFVFIAAWIFEVAGQPNITKKRLYHSLLLISFFLLSALSILYSSNLPPVMSKVETRLSLAAFPAFLLTVGRPTAKQIQVILACFLLSCLAISIVCTADTFITNFRNGLTYEPKNSWLFSSDNVVEKYGFHPNYFSIYCAFCMCILVYFYKIRKIKLVVAGALIAYFVLFILILASRVGIVAFVAVACFTILYEAYVAKKFWVGVGVLLAFFVSIVLVGMNFYIVREKFNAMLGIEVHQYNEHFRVNRRFIQWESAVEVFSKSPVIGVGIGDMQDELQKIYERKGFAEGFEYAYNPHNLFLDTAAALGTVGLLSLLLIFGTSIATAIRERDVLYMQFLLLFLTISLVESTFSVQKGIVFFALFNSLFYAFHFRETEKVVTS